MLTVLMLLQTRFEEPLQAYTFLPPLFVERPEIKFAVLVVISPGTIIHDDASDIVHRVCQIEQLSLAEVITARTAAKEYENLIDQVTISPKNRVWRMHNGLHRFSKAPNLLLN
jgi:hypothetical protein